MSLKRHRQLEEAKSHQNCLLIPEEFTPRSQWIDLAAVNAFP